MTPLRVATTAAGALALAVVLTAAGSTRVHGRAYPYGAPPGTTGGFGEPTCQMCHFGAELNDPAGSLTIEGLPVQYTPGQAYRLIIRLRRPDMAAAGFQLSARTAAGVQAGTLAPVDADGSVQVETAGRIHYAGHTEPGSRLATPGAAAWPVVWTAPATASGPITFHAAANAADDDRSALGDWVYAVERRAGPE
ncbi:MAG TPA: choice-of-anchor V domain-containing protein [Longimicrobium sp.]|nr:choice-of-anchor V domain-containing protein [Longimicrobium sp.]